MGIGTRYLILFYLRNLTLIHKPSHYSYVTWASFCLKSQTTYHSFHYGPFVRKPTDGFPSQRSRDGESVPISCHHHTPCCFFLLSRSSADDTSFRETILTNDCLPATKNRQKSFCVLHQLWPISLWKLTQVSLTRYCGIFNGGLSKLGFNFLVK